jgi:hypothetical protein
MSILIEAEAFHSFLWTKSLVPEEVDEWLKSIVMVGLCLGRHVHAIKNL